MMEIGHGNERSHKQSKRLTFKIIVMKDIHSILGLPNVIMVENLLNFFPDAW